MNANELAKDIENGTLPDLALYIPDQKNDAHDTSAAYADRGYSRAFGPLLQNPKFMDDLLLVTTFDEDDYTDPTNRIYTSIYGNSVLPGSISNDRLDLYSLLRLIEDTFNLGSLNRKDRGAPQITGIWK